MLRSLSLRNKLLLAVGLPMILLAVAAGLALNSSLTDAQQASEQATRVDTDLTVLTLAQSIRAEQSAGLSGEQDDLNSAREQTDLRFNEALGGPEENRFLINRMQTELGRIRSGLGDDALEILLETVQEQGADAGANTPVLDLQDDLADLAGQPLVLVEGSTDSYRTGRAATQVSTIVALVRWDDAILRERGLVNVLIGTGELSYDQQQRLQEVAVNAEQAQNSALTTGLDGFDMSDSVTLPANAALQDYRERIRLEDQAALDSVVQDDVLSDADILLDEIATEQEILIEQVEEENDAALSSAIQTQRIVIIAAVFVILGTAYILFKLYRAITNPIIQLSSRGRRVANDDLPNLVQKIRSGEAKAGDHEIIPLESETDDEIGELVTVFNELHSTAVGMAAEQAQSRQNAAEMFVNLGRRNQRILDTVLRDLDVLEHDEEDPNRLSQLYLVDQKVTRMRRNAESLLVLAGTQTPRQWAQPANLGDVVRAAMSEVENFERVDQSVDNSVEVPGNAVADLTHLLAELIENALRFSPPDENVLVHSDIVGDQTHIYVTDRGFGMKPEKLEAANNQIEEAATSEETPSKHLGLYVVGRLATRHGILVELNTDAETGLTADVNLSGLTKTLKSTDGGGAAEKPSPVVAETPAAMPAPDTAPSPSSDDTMPEIEPAVPVSEEVSAHVEQTATKPQPETAEAVSEEIEESAKAEPAKAEAAPSRGQPDFAEMTKPRAPKRRVPGASLPTNLKQPASGEPKGEAAVAKASKPEDVRDAFSGFQQSSGASDTGSSESKPEAKAVPEQPSTEPAAEANEAPKKERRAQPDFAEMTKPRAPKRRVPGATFQAPTKKKSTDAPTTEAKASKPEDVRDAFSGFQKSATTSTKSDNTESDDS